MTNTKNVKDSTLYITQVAMLIAIELVMRVLGLGNVPVGPLNMSFMTVPTAIGAILLGPLAGVILGGVFGLTSFWDALSGKSVMTGTFLQLSPVNTFILCVVMRMLMGLCTALIYRAVKKIDPTKVVRYFIGAICAPLLNTFFFMGFICLVFYNTEYIQNLVTKLGVSNPIAFVIALVGTQGLVEAVVCAVVGGLVAKGVSLALKLG